LSDRPEFSQAQRQRKKAEALFAELKSQIDLRRLRLRRLKFVREQFFLAAAAQNISDGRASSVENQDHPARDHLVELFAKKESSGQNTKKSVFDNLVFQHPQAITRDDCSVSEIAMLFRQIRRSSLVPGLPTKRARILERRHALAECSPHRGDPRSDPTTPSAIDLPLRHAYYFPQWLYHRNHLDQRFPITASSAI
jgi:hypothetical protein